MFIGGIAVVAIATGLFARAYPAFFWPVLALDLWLLYLYWQWLHYTRQSEGVSKAYSAKASDKDLGNGGRPACVLCRTRGRVLHVSAGDPGLFLPMPVKTLAIPDAILAIADVVALSSFLAWCYQ